MWKERKREGEAAKLVNHLSPALSQTSQLKAAICVKTRRINRRMVQLSLAQTIDLWTNTVGVIFSHSGLEMWLHSRRLEQWLSGFWIQSLGLIPVFSSSLPMLMWWATEELNAMIFEHHSKWSSSDLNGLGRKKKKTSCALEEEWNRETGDIGLIPGVSCHVYLAMHGSERTWAGIQKPSLLIPFLDECHVNVCIDFM